MTVAVGTRLGPYEIVAPIGAGGMGEVYRARDTKLDRAVAIKILPESFAHDPDRLARFEREAKTLASLNHPNIASIHGFEQSNGIRALVMELVEGPTLADRIAEGRIPLDEALPIAKQITEALEAAHEQGIVHRDLKPANIKLRPDGTVKVLDFGLAKALSNDRTGSDGASPLSFSPTVTSPAQMTGIGVILGTAAYMSPEQARGRAVDRRADIWAFGCVLFEMLAGRRPFDGDDVAETVGAIIHKQPDWSLLPANTPPSVHRLLQRCLEKEPKQRLRDIGDARLEIDIALREPNDTDQTTVNTRRSRSRVALVGWLIAVPLGLAAAVVGYVHFSERPPESPSAVRFEIGAPDKTTLVTGGTISPDGRLIAFGARDDRGLMTIWVRSIDSLEARPLAGTGRNVAYAFFWSPDSRFVGYAAADRTLKKISVSGGPPETLVNLEGTYTGAAMNSDGLVIFGLQGQGLRQVPPNGGTPSALTTVDRSREISHVDPVFLPDGRHFLYTRIANNFEATGVYVGTLSTGSNSTVPPQPLLRAASSAVFAPSSNANVGHLLFRRGGTLMAQPFDADRVQLSGEAVPVAENVPAAGPRGYSASTTGVLTLRIGSARLDSRLTWFDRSGKPLGTVGPSAVYWDVAVTPDGKTLAVSEREARTDTTHLWVVDLERQVPSRLNPGNERDGAPAVSNDGRIVFTSGVSGDLYIRSASGAGDAELLWKSENMKFPGDWSADGRYIIFDDMHPSRRADLWVVPLTADRKAIPFLTTPANESLAKFSPDNRWVVYASDESGRREVYVRDFAPDRIPAVGKEKIKISPAGGDRPRWRPDGSEIYYIATDRKMMAVPVKVGPTLQPGMAVPLFDTRVAGTIPYDVTADGRFLINTLSDENSLSSSPPIIVVMNWQTSLKK
jgi:serine/threonine protein kinase/Tol biopolymer transport system component